MEDRPAAIEKKKTCHRPPFSPLPVERTDEREKKAVLHASRNASALAVGRSPPSPPSPSLPLSPPICVPFLPSLSPCVAPCYDVPRYIIAVLRTHEIICVDAGDWRGPKEVQRFGPPPYLRPFFFHPSSLATSVSVASPPAPQKEREARRKSGSRREDKNKAKNGKKVVSDRASPQEKHSSPLLKKRTGSHGTILASHPRQVVGRRKQKGECPASPPYPTSFSLIPPSIATLFTSTSSSTCAREEDDVTPERRGSHRRHREGEEEEEWEARKEGYTTHDRRGTHPNGCLSSSSSSSLSPLLRGVVGVSDGHVNVFSEDGYTFGFAAHPCPVIAAHAIYTVAPSPPPVSPTLFASPHGAAAAGRTRSDAATDATPVQATLWQSEDPLLPASCFASLGFLTCAMDGGTFVWYPHAPAAATQRKDGSGIRARLTYTSQRVFPEPPIFAKAMALAVYYPPVVGTGRFLTRQRPEETMWPPAGTWRGDCWRRTFCLEDGGMEAAAPVPPSPEGNQDRQRKRESRGGGVPTVPSSHLAAASSSWARQWQLASLLPCAVLCRASSDRYTTIPFYPFSNPIPSPASSHVSFAPRSTIRWPLGSSSSSSAPTSSSSSSSFWSSCPTATKKKTVIRSPATASFFSCTPKQRSGHQRRSAHCTAIAVNDAITLVAREKDIFYLHLGASCAMEAEEEETWMGSRPPSMDISSGRHGRGGGSGLSRGLQRLHRMFSRPHGEKRDGTASVVIVDSPSDVCGVGGDSPAARTAQFPPMCIFHASYAITSMELGHRTAVLSALKEGVLTLIAPTVPTAVRLAEYHSYRARPLRQVVWCEDAALLTLVDKGCGVVELVVVPPAVLFMGKAVMESRSGVGAGYQMGETRRPTTTTMQRALFRSGGRADVWASSPSFASRAIGWVGSASSSIACALHMSTQRSPERKHRRAFFSSSSSSWWPCTASEASAGSGGGNDGSSFFLPPPTSHPLELALPSVRVLQARCAIDEVLAQRRHEKEQQRRAQQMNSSLVHAMQTVRPARYRKGGGGGRPALPLPLTQEKEDHKEAKETEKNERTHARSTQRGGSSPPRRVTDGKAFFMAIEGHTPSCPSSNPPAVHAFPSSSSFLIQEGNVARPHGSWSTFSASQSRLCAGVGDCAVVSGNGGTGWVGRGGGSHERGGSIFPSLQRCREALLLARMLCPTPPPSAPLEAEGEEEEKKSEENPSLSVSLRSCTEMDGSVCETA